MRIPKPTCTNLISKEFLQVPLVYVIPVDSILGKLSLVQAGDTGTIPFEPTVRNQIDSDALCEKYYPGGRADSAPGKGDGTRLWHTNAWAMGGSRDM